VCLTWTDRRRDPQYAISLDAWERLQDARDARGRRLKVRCLPMPAPLGLRAREAAGVIAREGTQGRVAGERLAASYVNFYIANGGIIMPLLDARTDRTAARRLKSLFPARRVVGVPAREILLGGGNIHCITQQVPAAGMSRRRAPVPAAS
jgi:agmatine deiminase